MIGMIKQLPTILKVVLFGAVVGNSSEVGDGFVTYLTGLEDIAMLLMYAGIAAAQAAAVWYRRK